MPNYPLIVPSVPVGGGPPAPSGPTTLADGLERFANELGGYLRTLTSSTQPSGGEPGRWVTVDEIKDDEDQRARFADGWLSVDSGAQAPAQRRIRRTGYEGPFGAVALSRVLEQGNLLPNVTVRLTHPLPIHRVGTTRGLTDLWTDGLGRARAEVRIPFDGNGTAQYPLEAYDWLVSQDQVDGVYDWGGLPTSIYPPQLSGYEPTITTHGGQVTLETGQRYSDGSAFWLRAFAPANRLVYRGGVWTWTSGLLLDDDRMAVPIDWALPYAMVAALEYLLRLVPQRLRAQDLTEQDAAPMLADYQRRLPQWVRKAAWVTRAVLPRPLPARRRLTLAPQWYVLEPQSGPFVGGRS